MFQVQATTDYYGNTRSGYNKALSLKNAITGLAPRGAMIGS